MSAFTRSLLDVSTFGVKTVLVVVGVVIVVGFIARALSRPGRSGTLKIRSLNDGVRSVRQAMQQALMPAKAFKAMRKAEAKADKAEGKQTEPVKKRRAFVIDFKGDIAANSVENLRREVTGVLTVAEAGDQVVVRIESPGGTVPGYGLAASQLSRLRDAGVEVVACVDKVAASGGYMMAAVADRILAAPFAIIGSIGVVAQIPNVHRLLKGKGVDFHEVTAGKFKRTVSVLGEVTPAGTAKLKEQLEETHELFKGHIAAARPQVDIERVATGEYWYGTQALKLALVDHIQTSDDYIIGLTDDAEVLRVTYEAPMNVRTAMVGAALELSDRLLIRWWSRAESARFH